MILKNKLYHFYEIGICGYSGSGKSCLIQKLLKYQFSNYKVFYCKHDAHKFEIDHHGKDTYEAINAGASGVSIYNENKWATIQKGEFNLPEKKLISIDYDFALIEGHKKTEIPKILILDESLDVLADLKENNISNILAIVTPRKSNHLTKFNVPVFHRDEIKEIGDFILNYFSQEYKKLPLNGLILVGGKSSRMGEDKFKLNYHQENQAEYLSKLLKDKCQKVFFSCRKEQTQDDLLSKYEKIEDIFSGIGPTGGILSYFKKHPLTRVLVVACDMPFIESSSIDQLINEENPFKIATTFVNEDKKWPEPLFTIYQPKTYSRLLQMLAIGYDCPMKLLFNSDIKKVTPINPMSIKNINTQDEKIKALTDLNIYRGIL